VYVGGSPVTTPSPVGVAVPTAVVYPGGRGGAGGWYGGGRGGDGVFGGGGGGGVFGGRGGNGGGTIVTVPVAPAIGVRYVPVATTPTFPAGGNITRFAPVAPTSLVPAPVTSRTTMPTTAPGNFSAPGWYVGGVPVGSTLPASFRPR
jgi:hypothetical protein